MCIYVYKARANEAELRALRGVLAPPSPPAFAGSPGPAAVSARPAAGPAASY